MKYYLIAGEASGDLHGSNLMKALREKDAAAEFRFWGGDLMQEQGGTNVSHYKARAFMGFLEVIKNLGTVLGFIRQCKKDLLANRPDALILIDYPGFNLRIAEFAKKQGIRVFFYISPQVWAWKENRVKKIRKFVDRMLVILPFEKDFYRKWDYEVDFVGHPLLDAIEGVEPAADFLTENQLDERPVIALLPGSRKQEIAKMLEIMLQVIPSFPGHQFVIAGAPSIGREEYAAITGKKPVKLVENKTYALLQHAEAALVTSGTATLETALFDVPEVVCYKGSAISYQIAKKLISIKYISLVNLVMDKPVVTELIQDELTPENITRELKKIIVGGVQRKRMKQDFLELREKLGSHGASQRTAELIINDLTLTV